MQSGTQADKGKEKSDLSISFDCYFRLVKSEDIQVTTGSHLVLDLLFSTSPQVISQLVSSSFLCTQVLVCPNYIPKLTAYNMCVCVLSCSIVPNPLQLHGLQPTSLLYPWNFPGKNFLLQGIFPTQGFNLCLLHLLHWQADSLPLSHLGSPNSKSYLKLGYNLIIIFNL